MIDPLLSLSRLLMLANTLYEVVLRKHAISMVVLFCCTVVHLALPLSTMTLLWQRPIGLCILIDLRIDALDGFVRTNRNKLCSSIATQLVYNNRS